MEIIFSKFPNKPRGIQQMSQSYELMKTARSFSNMFLAQTVREQQKNTETHNLEQLLPAEKEDLPSPPLLDPAHTPLLEGSYPHATWQPPQTWNTP